MQQFRIWKQRRKHVCSRVLHFLAVLTLAESSESWQAQIPWQLYLLAENERRAKCTRYCAFCSSSNDSFEPLEISNYCTPLPRNRPLSILQTSVLSLNNFLNKDGAAHHEIFTTQFSRSSRLRKIHNYMMIHNVTHLGYFGKLSSFLGLMLNLLAHEEKCILKRFWDDLF